MHAELSTGFMVFVYGAAGIGIEQSIHDYPTPLITINLPLANFFLGAPAAFANIVGIYSADGLAGADHLFLTFLAHWRLVPSHRVILPIEGNFQNTILSIFRARFDDQCACSIKNYFTILVKQNCAIPYKPHVRSTFRNAAL